MDRTGLRRRPPAAPLVLVLQFALLSAGALLPGCPSSEWDPSLQDARRDASGVDVADTLPGDTLPGDTLLPDATPADAAPADAALPDARPVDAPPAGDVGAGDTFTDVPIADVPTVACQTDEDCEGELPLVACQVARCAVEGRCVVRAAVDGAACDDEDPCTGDDHCVDSVCAGLPIEGCCAADGDCDDGDPCSIERCDAGTKRCARAAVECPTAEDAACGAAVCRLEGRCDPVELVRPVVLWERGLEPGEPNGLRSWPEGAWKRVEEGAHAGVGALELTGGVPAGLRLPPVAVPGGTVTFEAWLWQPGGDCGDTGAALAVSGEGISAAIPCATLAGWTRVVVPVGAAATRSLALRLDADVSAVRLDDLRLVHRGRGGCPIGAPRALDTDDDPTRVAVAASGASGLVAWAEADAVVRLATGVSPFAPPPVGQTIATVDLADVLFDVAVAAAPPAVAVAWGGLPAVRESRAWHDAGGDAGPLELSLAAPDDGRNVRPRVAPAGEGRFQYVWTWRSGGLFAVWTLRAPAPEDQDAPLLVADGAEAPDVVRLEDGDLVVVWAAEDGSGIGAQRIDATTGAPAGDRVVVATAPTGGSSTAPRAAALADGGWVVAWEADDDDSDGVDLRWRRFGAEDAPATEPAVVPDVTRRDQRMAAIAPRPNGGFTVFWTSNDEIPAATALRYRVFDPDGPVAPSAPLLPGAEAGSVDHVSPAATPLAPDGPLVAWLDEVSGALEYTILPGACPLGWWACEEDTPTVCIPTGYAPLLGLCEGEVCVAEPTCP